MTEHEKDRRKNLEALRAMGIDPYATTNLKIEPIDRVRAKYLPGVEEEHVVAGRIKLMRDLGSLIFITLIGETGEIQIGCMKNKMAPEKFAVCKLLDLGDIVVAEGMLSATKTGEITIWSKMVTIVSKSLTPPPSKLEGLTDQELRYRNRHTDLWVNPLSRSVLVGRSHIIECVRKYLWDKDFIEVETPIMQVSAGGAKAKPFKTHHEALDQGLFLRIAPELYLKKLLIGGMRKVFEIGKNFRNEGLSPRHNPEFTVIEGYEAFSDHIRMMDLVEDMIWGCVFKLFENTKIKFGNGNAVIELTPPWQRVDLVEITNELFREQESTLEERYAGFEKYIQPTLIQPTFVTGLPASAVPLAKEKDEDGDNIAQAFELIIGGIEIACGYSELNDPDVQLRKFENQAGEDQHVLDVDFIDAMKTGMPPAGGFGIGLDRLVMILMERTSIRDVIFFPLMRPE